MDVRPGAIEFLEEVGKVYELIIYTRLTKEHVEKILKVLDPENSIFSRIYSEESLVPNASKVTICPLMLDEG